MIRKPCVANKFYPGAPEILRTAVEAYLKAAGVESSRAMAIVSPHAGYMYSGGMAGMAFASVDVPDAVILIGPNHTGFGERVSVMGEGRWDTPLGPAAVNEELANLILDSHRLFSDDDAAHIREHSLEVQLPFILAKNPKASIVPITVMPLKPVECRELGGALASAIKTYGKDVLIVASSDMNHYESDDVTRKKDKLALDKLVAMDADGLLQVTGEKKITMCGAVPAAIAMTAAISLGASSAKVVGYATSGDASGDYKHVVGYAAAVIK